MAFYKNGIVVQSLGTDQAVYQGFQRYNGIARYDTWPLESRLDKTSKALSQEAWDNWFSHFSNRESQQVALEVVPSREYIDKYVRQCKAVGLKTRLLFCETSRSEPLWESKNPELRLLGYDYATSAGSYSTIPGDLLGENVPQVLLESRSALNANGLFNDEAQLLKYVNGREKSGSKAGNPEFNLDYCVFRISELLRFS